jgi:hypothetical protein
VRALRANGTEAQRLGGLVKGHVQLSIDDPDLVAVSITELSYASDEVRDSYQRNQADREAEWTDLVRKLVPATTVAEARLLVAAALSFIEDVARTWHLTRYAGVGDEMTAIAMSILMSRSPQGADGAAVGELSGAGDH